MPALSEEITVKKLIDALRVLPTRLHRLYLEYQRRSHDGREKVYAVAAVIYRSLGMKRSTFYDQRKELARLGVLDIEQRKVSACWNETSLVSVASLKTLASRMWARIQSLRCPDFRTEQTKYNRETIIKRTQNAHLKSPIYRELMRNGLGKKKAHNLC
jgi:hypothetical protein